MFWVLKKKCLTEMFILSTQNIYFDRKSSNITKKKYITHEYIIFSESIVSQIKLNQLIIVTSSYLSINLSIKQMEFELSRFYCIIIVMLLLIEFMLYSLR